VLKSGHSAMGKLGICDDDSLSISTGWIKEHLRCDSMFIFIFS
jgi:hypothetical protein